MNTIKLEPGMLIETNYSGPYRVKSVSRNCTCPSYVNSINMSKPPAQEPHIHIVCSNPDGTGEFYLNNYDEETLQSTDKSWNENEELEQDYITILEQDKPIQKTFF